ncbi:MAG TPA: hypothetical protein VFE38_15340 [Edaphobacter sp.]|nr:hypothetical protein [Edaphobacter sp.]
MENDPRWELVQRIVRTQGFAKSERLSAFLLYISRQTIINNSGILTEQKIGEAVFGRPIAYDPRDDNIVRAHASRLRKRLEDYYNEDGREERIRVSVPRGTYVPVFESVTSQTIDPPAVAENVVITEPLQPVSHSILLNKQPHWTRWIAIACCIVLALAGSFFLGRLANERDQAVTPGSTHRIWAQMFSSGHKTLIVPADSSLVVLRVFTGTPIDVNDYANGRYLTDFTCKKPCDRTILQRLVEHRYTSTADLEFTLSLFQLPEARQNPPVIRYARDLQLDDLKDFNVIMIGSIEADPWVELFRDKEAFILQDNTAAGPLGVENRHPLQGEQAFYRYDRAHFSHGLATISFRPNLSGQGNILLVQGFSLADTQAAADLLMNEKTFDSILRPKLGQHSECPHFEALLETDNVNGMGVPTRLLAFRTF